MSILISLLPLAFIIGITVLVIQKVADKDKHANSSAQPVRLFFQYAIAFGLFIIVAVGLAGLLGRFIFPSNLLVDNQSSLASNLAFVVVGAPLLVGISVWLKRSIKLNPQDGKGFVPTFFATLISVIALLIFMSSLISAFQRALSDQTFNGDSLARAIVWAAALMAVLRISNSIIPRDDFRIHYFVGSLITGIGVIVGLIKVSSGALVIIFGIEEAALVAVGDSTVVDGLVILLISIALWFYYWVKNANTKRTDLIWSAYVLIAGVGAALVLTITSATVALYTTLVWFTGDPTSQIATSHFSGTPTALASAGIGAMAWWYHKSLLPRGSERSEVQRVYEYVVAAISLVASTVGIGIVIVAIVEGLTSQVRLTGNGATNTLLAAGTVIAVSAPVWWRFWNRIQKLAKLGPVAELGSSVRKIYLFLLFGAGGAVAIISLIGLVFQLFDALLGAGLGASTLNDMRYSIATLISTGIVAGYHWEIYRHEKEVHSVVPIRNVTILLVGPSDEEFTRELQVATGARITSWQRTDLDNQAWPLAQVVELVKQSDADQLLVLLESTGVKLIPVRR